MASVATFDDTMADIVYMLDDREIHNDIRSETRVSEDVEIDDSDWLDTIITTKLRSLTLFPETSSYLWSHIDLVPLGVSADDIISGVWEGTHLYWDIGTSSEVRVDFSISVSIDALRGTVTVPAAVGDPTHTEMYSGDVYITYNGQEWQEGSHIETQWSTLTVRVTDPTSILKYGRRVLNLTWPLGATQVQTQSIAESYRDKYSEPVSRITMLVKGKTDALKVQILTREISELITVISSELGLNADYYINRIDYKEFTDSLPQVTWALEEQRTSEAAGIFLIDTSELDGTTWIG